MKKAFKILGITAFIAVIGFSMAACKEDDDSPTSPKQFIKVEGIPSTYNKKYAILILSTPGESNIIAYSSMEIIGNTYTFPLYNREKPWEGNGDFGLKILIFDNAATEKWTYAGVQEINIEKNTPISHETSISGKITNVSWDLFIDRT